MNKNNHIIIRLSVFDLKWRILCWDVTRTVFLTQSFSLTLKSILNKTNWMQYFLPGEQEFVSHKYMYPALHWQTLVVLLQVELTVTLAHWLSLKQLSPIPRSLKKMIFSNYIQEKKTSLRKIRNRGFFVKQIDTLAFI